MKKLNVKKDDTVVVISGKDKGKKGEIFGQVGLNYGPEWLHGKITNLTTE